MRNNTRCRRPAHGLCYTPMKSPGGDANGFLDSFYDSKNGKRLIPLFQSGQSLLIVLVLSRAAAAQWSKPGSVRKLLVIARMLRSTNLSVKVKQKRWSLASETSVQVAATYCPIHNINNECTFLSVFTATKIFITAGDRLTGSQHAFSEVIDISGKKMSCQNPASYPIRLKEFQGSIKTKDGASKNLKDYDCWENDLKPE